MYGVLVFHRDASEAFDSDEQTLLEAAAADVAFIGGENARSSRTGTPNTGASSVTLVVPLFNPPFCMRLKTTNETPRFGSAIPNRTSISSNVSIR